MLYYQKTNKYHKPVHLKRIDFEEPKMLRINRNPKPVNENIYVTYVLDNSASMGVVREEAIRALNAQLNTLREEAKKSSFNTFVKIVTFNHRVELCQDWININEVESIDSNTYYTNGNTALNDAISYSLSNRYGVLNSRSIVVIITDGEENASVRSYPRKEMIDAIADSRTTLVACIPPTYSARNYFSLLNFPQGNITEWETTRESVNTLSTNISRGTTATFAAYNAGATRSVSYFQPDLNNLQPTVVATNLDDLSNRFAVHPVNGTEAISSFVARTTGKPYKVGNAYYQLTKKETVQAGKDILLRDKNGRVFGGDNARSLLRIPAGGTIELNPASSPDYSVFVKSTSHNRKLLPNTNVLIAR